MNELLRENQGPFNDLVLSLSHEVALYDQLALMLKSKQKAIIQGDVDLLQNLVHEEHRLIPKIRLATQARELRAAAIGALADVGAKTPSLKELIDLSPSHHTQTLIGHREKLIAALDRIAHANRENEFLLNSSLELVRGLVQVLLGREEHETVHYGGKGKINNDQTRRAVVDCQI